MVFGLGTTEIVLVAALILALLGPQGVKQIKPFFKSLYKGYLTYQQKVREGKEEFADLTGDLRKEVEAVKAEAEKELMPEIEKLRKEVEANRRQLEQKKQGFSKRVNFFNQEFKKNYSQMRKEASSVAGKKDLASLNEKLPSDSKMVDVKKDFMDSLPSSKSMSKINQDFIDTNAPVPISDKNTKKLKVSKTTKKSKKNKKATKK